MDELFQKLELRIRTLLRKYEGLEQSHQQLTQVESKLARENSLLAEKNRSAIVQIQQILSRLKSIEKPL